MQGQGAVFGSFCCEFFSIGFVVGGYCGLSARRRGLLKPFFSSDFSFSRHFPDVLFGRQFFRLNAALYQGISYAAVIGDVLIGYCLFAVHPVYPGVENRNFSCKAFRLEDDGWGKVRQSPFFGMSGGCAVEANSSNSPPLICAVDTNARVPYRCGTGFHGYYASTSPLLICFSYAWRTSPSTYGSFFGSLRSIFTSPLPQRPRFVTSLASS